MNPLLFSQQAKSLALVPRSGELAGQTLYTSSHAESVIKQQKQLYSGYWANLVTYSIARLMHETDGWVDFYHLWKELKLWPELEQTLLDLANSAWVWINAHPDGGNMTQYCKRKECWDGFLNYFDLRYIYARSW